MDSLELLHRGFIAFQEKRYWEAHEDWEEVWHTLEGKQKKYLQALIQIAAARFHLQKENLAPAKRLSLLASKKLKETRGVGFPIKIEGEEIKTLRLRWEP